MPSFVFHKMHLHRFRNKSRQIWALHHAAMVRIEPHTEGPFFFTRRLNSDAQSPSYGAVGAIQDPRESARPPLVSHEIVWTGVPAQFRVHLLGIRISIRCPPFFASGTVLLSLLSLPPVFPSVPTCWGYRLAPPPTPRPSGSLPPPGGGRRSGWFWPTARARGPGGDGCVGARACAVTRLNLLSMQIKIYVMKLL